MYRFEDSGRTRVFEDHPIAKWGWTGATLELSDPDSQGRRLLLTNYTSTQCGSSWMGMAYSVYRLGAQSGASELLFADEHGFWLGNGPEFVHKPDELIIEFLGHSVDPGIQNRTHYDGKEY